MRFLDQVSCVLLDLNGTFMFGYDRFDSGDDLHATYVELGGTWLTGVQLHGLVRRVFQFASGHAQDSRYYDDFPSLAGCVARCLGEQTAAEQELVAKVIGRHEVGRISAEHAACVRALARSHPMGLISNIWSPPDYWLPELGRAGVLSAFQTIVWSSDGNSIKPSKALFHQALHALDVDPAAAVMVGDSLRCDIQPAHELGMRTVWLTADQRSHPQADRVASSLLDVPALP